MSKPFPDEFLMIMALKEAMKTMQEKEVPVGSVIVAGNQITGRGLSNSIHILFHGFISENNMAAVRGLH